MRTLTRWFPDWIRPGRQRADGDVCVYVSGSAVAVARQGARADGEPDIALRADPIRRPADVRDVLKTQVDAVGIAGRSAVMVLAPELYTLSLLERPDVADDEVNEAVRWRLQETVDYAVDQATIDTFDLPEGAGRDRPMVFVAALQTESLRVILEMTTAAGLHVHSVDIAELALRNLAYRLHPEPDHGVGMVRITSSGGMINVSRGDELFLSRRISGLPADYDANDWDDLKDRLLLQIQRSIDYYESALQQPPCPQLLVATTQGWQQHVVDHLDEMLPLSVAPLVTDMAREFHVTLHNPEPEEIDWNALDVQQVNAIAAATPALGGVLHIPEAGV